jgi:starch synthase
MAYQGAFPAESFHKSGLPKELFHVDGVEAYGRFNFLKTGLHFADVITTVSRKYADEISSSEEYGSGLMGLLSKRKKDLHGILNGIDYNVWNPAADDLIYRKYDVKSLDAKLDNKRALADRFHMPFKESTPIIGAISRMVEQKGFDLVLEVMEDLLKMNVQFILLGDGDKATEKRFEAIQKKYPQQIGVFFGFDKELAHLIEAGSDLFVMPSRYEPCGLNQMYSMRYGRGLFRRGQRDRIQVREIRREGAVEGLPSGFEGVPATGGVEENHAKRDVEGLLVGALCQALRKPLQRTSQAISA